MARASRKLRRRKLKRCSKKKRHARTRSKRFVLSSDASAARRRKRKARCAPRKKRRRKAPTQLPSPRQPTPVVPIAPVPPAPKPPPPPVTVGSPIAKYGGPFGIAQAERLLWRAGFGPSPGHAAALASMGMQKAVASLTQPSGAPTLTGAEPHDAAGHPLSPADAWGDDHLWFLDRMVRTNQPLIERMTLIWHDWFATSNSAFSQQQLMLDQNELFRRSALGSFEQLVKDVTQNPAMILFLNLDDNTRSNPNENYARELMELFTLGADRAAYSEDDVRELARALTGFRKDWSAELGYHNFRYDATWHDATNKTVFGSTGNFDWQDAAQMVVHHPLHPSFFVTKLWSYFIPVPPSTTDRQKLEATYTSSGYQIRPIVEAILMHPQLYTGPRLVKPPVVFVAGMLRALQRTIDTEAWVWLCEGAGQQLFYPPNVAGWDDSKWLDTSTLRGRWMAVAQGLSGRHLQGTALDNYDDTETPEQAVTKARAFWGNPAGMTSEALTTLTDFALDCLPAVMVAWQQHEYRGLRQNALRQLLFSSPDLQTS
jgi:uncharacterized protein (DUF1800 family)